MSNNTQTSVDEVEPSEQDKPENPSFSGCDDEKENTYNGLEKGFQLSATDASLLENLIPRSLWKESIYSSLLLEHVISVSTKCVDEIFYAGSVGEGLGLISLFMEENFDIDVMLTDKNRLVVERQDIHLHECFQILKLQNSSSYPGYATLKLPYTNCDAEYLYGEDFKHELKDSFITESISVLFEYNACSIITTHGPAKVVDFDWNYFRDRSPEIIPMLPKTIDFVSSIRCFEWPSVADEWTDRRRFNWPSIELITEIKKMGCDVVPFGCHGSSTHIKEWRISFVRAERHLIHSLNDAQLKTFVLLKMVFRSRVLGAEFHNTISSYVAKCSFFWVSEEHDGTPS
uniref:Uncharacterized protein LOC111101042 isoform X2 n=1 Tax=Crassostrea virginica TaxID=6565 RepID=A0A8B8AES3_CRAVI|nr:uncharacterized protein LOC111101042 isoform X2 [Crassostrea virginica]